MGLEEFSGATAHAQCTSFHVKSACDGYELIVTADSGNAGDSLEYHSFFPFDRDQDGHGTINCAERYHGAWWYGSSSCNHYNLNGIYVAIGSGSRKNRYNPVTS